MNEIKDIAPVRIRGRTFTENDLQVILSCVDRYYKNGRTYISRRICEELDWKQPNGWLKDRACRDVLLKLDNDKIISLPPSLNGKRKKDNKLHQKEDKNCSKLDLVTTKIDGEIPEGIELLFAKGNKFEKLWNNMVGEYHYLGHTVTVGRSIKYLIRAKGQYLGAIAFSSPAWRLGPRDKLLAKLGFEKPLKYTINNSRFLILPNVNVKNLASHLLALSTNKIVKDWESYYSIEPLFVETFVQPSRFDGTCYKAANWLQIGLTQGYSKKGRDYKNSQEKKKIFLYGLNKDTRKQLMKVTQEGKL